MNPTFLVKGGPQLATLAYVNSLNTIMDDSGNTGAIASAKVHATQILFQIYIGQIPATAEAKAEADLRWGYVSGILPS